MNKVKIIRPLNLYSKMGGIKGKLMKPLICYFLLMGLVIGLVGAFVVDNFFIGLLLFLWLLMCVAAVIVLFSGGEYKPEKSYFFWRLSKEKMAKYYKYYTIGGIVIIVLISLYEFKVQYIFYLLSVYAALYFANKSFSVHEDVDFVTNSEVSELLGMEIDEKVQASYQNFDSSSVKKGSNMILLTDKKLLFAFYDGTKWSLMNKMLKEITEIGRLSTDGIVNLTSSSSFLHVAFSDNTCLGLHMDLYDKMTSNPDLFFKKFLTTLDTFLLGKTDEKIASRRRVSINSDNKVSTKSNEENTNVRSIDVSNTIVDNLRNAVPVEVGRVLEF